MPLVAFIIAAVCFLLAWIEADIAHAVDAGWFFMAVGLALTQAGLPPWPRRTP